MTRLHLVPNAKADGKDLEKDSWGPRPPPQATKSRPRSLIRTGHHTDKGLASCCRESGNFNSTDEGLTLDGLGTADGGTGLAIISLDSSPAGTAGEW